MEYKIRDDDELSLGQYMAQEEGAEYKSQYFNGEIEAMAGGSPRHSRIAMNCTHAMMKALGDGRCQVYDSNLMIQIERLNTVLYPDGSIVCGPLEVDPDAPHLVRNPSLILEVLSNGTRSYDRGGKFIKYQMIPSLKTYVLVEQKEPRVFVAHKSPSGEWAFDDYFGLEEVVDLKPLGISITMEQIYWFLLF